jgi:hypothetical protein
VTIGCWPKCRIGNSSFDARPKLAIYGTYPTNDRIATNLVHLNVESNGARATRATRSVTAGPQSVPAVGYFASVQQTSSFGAPDGWGMTSNRRKVRVSASVSRPQKQQSEHGTDGAPSHRSSHGRSNTGVKLRSSIVHHASSASTPCCAARSPRATSGTARRSWPCIARRSHRRGSR